MMSSIEPLKLCHWAFPLAYTILDLHNLSSALTHAATNYYAFALLDFALSRDI